MARNAASVETDPETAKHLKIFFGPGRGPTYGAPGQYRVVHEVYAREAEITFDPQGWRLELQKSYSTPLRWRELLRAMLEGTLKEQRFMLRIYRRLPS